ncbi:hypothetical protein SmJEL517_g04169 [Synchytrium microbalum]|uniref:Small monomeric GTPase n=1 Tax=Synchytrium microbalum TaxID=1806994 RepID=A0A507C5S9_9FUNG|nr:uncharacterized protein SmJEL517_g04169 [Synchytrium microbalum]TPX32825.1 hypothetical protein SmJEL517_g04169 [Synchytrium microbalum]
MQLPSRLLKIHGSSYQVVVDDVSCIVEVLDTAGQDEYVSLRDQWIRDGEGFLLVYSTTLKSSFEAVEKFRDQVVRVKDNEKTPVILVGNKNDLPSERQVTREEGLALAKRLKCEFIETSAKTGVNVEKAFFQLIRMVRVQRFGTVPNNRQSAPRNSRNTLNRKKSCNIL